MGRSKKSESTAPKDAPDTTKKKGGEEKPMEVPAVVKEANKLFAKSYGLSAKDVEGKSTSEILAEAFPE
jgi:hypothetical protein